MTTRKRANAVAAAAFFACANACASGHSDDTPARAIDTGATDGGAVGFDVMSPETAAAVPCSHVDFLVAKAPGPDGAWGTADDVISYRELQQLDDRGRTTMSLEYESPGPDGVWVTSDDPEAGGDRYVYDGEALLPIERMALTSAGTDGISGTTDDPFGILERYRLDASGRVLGSIAFGGPGPDGSWRTSDDLAVAGAYYRSADDAKSPSDVFYSSGAGPDGAWGTADDAFWGRTAWTRAVGGQLALATDYASAGPNGTWGDADDVVRTSIAYDCEHQSFSASSSPGPDGVFGTKDDPIVSVTRVLPAPVGCGTWDLCRRVVIR